MTDCPACFLLFYCLGSGWVHLCVLLTLSNVLTAPYQDLSTSIWGSCDILINMCVSNITGCFQHLLEDADPPSADQPRVVMEPGLQCRLELCSPFCSGRESRGQRAPLAMPAPLAAPEQPPKQGLHPGTTLARLLGSLPPCSVQALSCLSSFVASCPVNSLNTELLGSFYKPPDLGQRLPCPAVTPVLSSAGSDKDYPSASVLHFTLNQERFILMLAVWTAVPVQESPAGNLFSNSEGAFRELGTGEHILTKNI